MKRSTHLVKAMGLLLALVVFNGTATARNSAKDKGQPLNVFFLNYLADKAKSYPDSKKLKSSTINEARMQVWEAWKDANNNSVEQKLIGLEPLDSARSGRWDLPADLEPDAVMPYYFGSKGSVKQDEKYPLYLYTHGSGDKDSEWETGIKICGNFKDSPSVYFIPQIPNEGDWYRWWQRSKQFAWEKLLRLALVSGKIDPNKIYVFGISEGGYGSQRLASYYADYLAAAGPMAGGEPLKNAPVENCRNIAFSLRTGANDNGFYREKLTRYTKEEFEKFEKQSPGKFIHRIELIPGRGHGIDYSPTTPWMSQYVRNPYPKFVSWENFEMDGRYRQGFYNIWVKERSNDSNSRTYYEMDIQGNNISLRVDLVNYKATEIDPKWGIELKCEKNYTPATKGKVVIYLCPELVDLNKEVVLTVNGKEAFRGVAVLDLKHIVNSCAAFYDPQRLYPAAVEVDIEKLQ